MNLQIESFNKLVAKNRSYRRFFQEHVLTPSIFNELVDLARLSPSPKNKQVLKFAYTCTADKNSQVFETLAWAGYLKDWKGADEGERPSGYLFVLADSSLSNSFKADYIDMAAGIVAQTMLLGAVNMELGGCMIASFKKEKLHNLLGLSDNLDILLVLAIGKPKEEIQIEELQEGQSVEYWRDEDQVHHVPKRGKRELMINS